MPELRTACSSLLLRPLSLVHAAIVRTAGSVNRSSLIAVEAHYAQFLYGDTCLHQLPKFPELHILSTNLSVGGISSFNRSGLLMEQRSLAGGLNLVHHHVGLATVPMAVAAPRDWVTYLYIPVLLFVFGLLPWLGWRTYRHAHVNAMLTQAIAQSRDDYGKILELLEYGSVEPWKPMEFVEASEPSALFEEQGLDIISDTRITGRSSIPSRNTPIRAAGRSNCSEP